MNLSSCPKTHKDYKLPSAKATGKGPDWNFFTKFQASQWNFESFKLHHQARSKKNSKGSTIKNNYNSILEALISQKLTPPSLFSYIDDLKVIKKRKPCAPQAQKPHPPQTATTKGKGFINISNGQKQIINMKVTKRRKLGPSIQRMKKKEQEIENNAMESEEQGDSVDSASEEEGVLNLDTSFDSVDNHPKATHYYDYFKGNGQKEWRTTGEELPTISDDQAKISKIIREYRTDSVKAAQQLENISDCRILSLSFIYPFFNYNLDYSFTQSIKRYHGLICSLVKPFTPHPVPNEVVLWCHRLDSAMDYSKDGRLKTEVLNMKREMFECESKPVTATLTIVERIVKEIRYWDYSGTEGDFMTYLYYFTDEVFSFSSCPHLSVHKTLNHLSTDFTIKPDLKIAYEYKKGIQLDLCIAEIKKNSNTYAPNKSDFVKINLEMKLMLDKLIENNVEDPMAFGLLIQGFECFLFRMTLENDGFYFSPIVCRFHLPRDISDIMLVPKVTSAFLQLKQELNDLVNRIDNKKKGKSPLLSLTRPSYKMP